MGDALNLVIETWLQKSDPKPTWRALIQALCKKSVNKGALADETAGKYCLDELRSEEGTYDN